MVQGGGRSFCLVICRSARSVIVVIEKGKGERIMTLYDELVARGLIAQVTNEEEIKNMIN